MEDLVKAVQAADGPWPVLAIAILGVYVLLWRFGGKILDVVKEANTTAAAAHAEARSISKSIVTNHGSKNIGDAIDRLTESMSDVQARLTRLEGFHSDAA